MSEQAVNIVAEADRWLDSHRKSDTWSTMNRVRDELVRTSGEVAAAPRAIDPTDAHEAVTTTISAVIDGLRAEWRLYPDIYAKDLANAILASLGIPLPPTPTPDADADADADTSD